MPRSPGDMHLSVSLEHVVLSEIFAVTAAMRKNSRWASRSVWRSARDDALASSMGLRRAGTQSSSSVNLTERKEADLMLAFQDLKKDIYETSGIFHSFLCFRTHRANEH